MNNDKILNFGTQPIAEILVREGLSHHDLVAASTEQITHKMVARACKGRRLTKNVKCKVLKALNNATKKDYRFCDLFNY